jgi:endo-1,4-beta-xylanase
MKITTSGFPPIINFRIAGSCFLVLLASCTHVGPSSPAHFSPTPNPEFTLSPSASPFQPENPSPTPTASATLELSVTPTSSATIDPNLNGTLRYSADRIGFGIGTYFQIPEARDPLSPRVLQSEFNTLMMATFMKKTQPARDGWDWSVTDEVMQAGSANGQKIIGGPLVYDNPRAPAWLGFDKRDCGGWSADELEGILQTYIQTVVSRFRGKIYAWEVVNEPFSSDETCWHRILGEGYIGRAFGYAHAADPDARLFLNEAFGRDGVDRNSTDKFFSVVQSLRDAGAPLDSVGIQMHLNADILRPTYPEEFQYFLHQARKAGVRVLITEMDVYQGAPGFFQDPLNVQKQIFAAIARICLSFTHCTDLITWGISDRYTWLGRISGNDFIDPQPLLFDAQFQAKPAFYGVLEALQNTKRGSAH